MNKRFRKYYEKQLLKEEKITVTESQKKLIKALAEGFTFADTAKSLNISYNTLQKRIQKLYRQFNTHSRKELILKCLENHIIRFSDITPHFRKRFFSKPVDYPICVPNNSTEPLSEQERKCLKLIALGKTRKEIVQELKLLNINSYNYLQAVICRKLNAKNITNSMTIAYELGYLK